LEVPLTAPSIRLARSAFRTKEKTLVILRQCVVRKSNPKRGSPRGKKATGD